jgi:PPOX class probable F420-dependent enzyme
MIVTAPPPPAFDHHLVAALASVRPDGRPHVVPLWFSWDGTSFVIYSKPRSVKVRNLRHQPCAMLALGEPGGAGSAVLVEVRAEMATCSRLPTAFARKYAEPMAQLGLTCDEFAATYCQMIRLVPIRWVEWGE